MAPRHRKIDRALWAALWEPYRSPSQSLQMQVRRMLVAAMLDGMLPPATCLPSTRDLSRALRVSRNTVIIVYQQLADEGYLYAEPRMGYWVADALPGKAPSAAVAPTKAAASPASGPPDWDTRIRFRPDTQRNIEKRSNWRNYRYPFLYGQFDARLFPLADWRLCCLRTLNLLESFEWGQDMFLRDDPTLIQQIRTRLLTMRGIHAREDEIIITVGSQQGLYLLADLLMDPGVRVGMENPGYPDARNIFVRRQVRLTGLAVDDEGVVVDERLRGQQYVYVTPSHQCPTSVTLSMPRRQALLAMARESDFVVIEDDYETEDGWAGESIPALKSLDRDGRVIYVGSMSKSLAPGLRIGYVVAPVELVQALRGLRRLNIRHPNAYGQRALALFIGLGHHNTLLRKLAAEHARRAAALKQAMQRHLPDWRVGAVSGGSALWVLGPPGLDARQLSEAAERHGVLIEPGDVFFMNPPEGRPPADHARFFRMGFTCIGVADIEPGVQALRAAYLALQDGGNPPASPGR
jgi:GntR family transcriptional regulator/MocR family aminotransferase